MARLGARSGPSRTMLEQAREAELLLPVDLDFFVFIMQPPFKGEPARLTSHQFLRIFRFVSNQICCTMAVMRKPGLIYPLLLLVCWTGLIVAGTYALLETTVRQYLALNFSTTRGRIVRSEVGHSAMSRRGVDIEYNYAVAGVDYTGHRYRYDDHNVTLEWDAAVEDNPRWPSQTVYYNPKNPADALLEPGIDGRQPRHQPVIQSGYGIRRSVAEVLEIHPRFQHRVPRPDVGAAQGQDSAISMDGSLNDRCTMTSKRLIQSVSRRAPWCILG